MSARAEQLAEAIRVLGDTRKAAITRRAEVWAQTSGMGITERREEVRYAVADLDGMIVEQEAEVEALRVELEHGLT